MVAAALGSKGKWRPVAEAVAGRLIVVDCSNVQLLSSEMLSTLIVLQERVKQRQSKVVLVGLRAEVRDVLRWTKIDRFVEIEEALIEETPGNRVARGRQLAIQSLGISEMK